MKVRYRRQAQLDIDNIHEYIEKRNPRAATEVVARIRYAADRLGLWPYTGHVGRAPGTYEWVVAGLPYIIVYEMDEAADEVAIIAVFHGAQDRERH
jgi:toxin ParE1/3/4